jgi:3-oxoadipate enol-lactonase
MPRVRVDGISLAYERHGRRGDWVLLVHGLGYGRWGWAWNAPALARRFRVLSFDNRGIGGSDAPPGPYTVAEMAADAAGLLEALGIARAHVVGASLGGFIAQELARRWPERVGRLVLVATSFGGTPVFPMPERTARLLAGAPGLPERERLRLLVENALSRGFVRRHPEVVERLVRLRLRAAQPLEAWRAQAAAGAGFDSSGWVGEIRAETLVVVGASDAVIDPRAGRLLARAIPGARLARLPGGHLIMVEQATRFNDLVSRFLAGGARGLSARRPR